MKVGRRLAIKLLNASKFALSMTAEGGGLDAVTEPIDRSMLAGLAKVVEQATNAYEQMDYARALDVTETFFWAFCDDYLELVKDRAYGGQGADPAASAHAALRLALDVLLRLLAPVLSFATEEVWSWFKDGSVHLASWPTVEEVRPAGEADAALLPAVATALAGIRKAKSDAKLGMRAEVAAMTLAAPPEDAARIRSAEADLRAAGKVTGEITPADGVAIEVLEPELVAVAKPVQPQS
jgi:valyl-tRNA synthetase